MSIKGEDLVHNTWNTWVAETILVHDNRYYPGLKRYTGAYVIMMSNISPTSATCIIRTVSLFSWRPVCLVILPRILNYLLRHLREWEWGCRLTR